MTEIANPLIKKLSQAKGWSCQTKYPYPLLDINGDLIETLYLKPLSRKETKEVSQALELSGKDSSEFALRLLIKSAHLEGGEKAFKVSDIQALMREIPASRLNDLEMAVLNAGKVLSVEEEKND